MTDTPASTSKSLQGVAILVVIAFLLFGAAGFGWYAGAALARVLGI